MLKINIKKMEWRSKSTLKINYSDTQNSSNFEIYFVRIVRLFEFLFCGLFIRVL